jgi:hypothetical protein
MVANNFIVFAPKRHSSNIVPAVAVAIILDWSAAFMPLDFRKLRTTPENGNRFCKFHVDAA